MLDWMKMLESLKYTAALIIRNLSVTYPGCLRVRYTGLGARKTFFKFPFFSCISTKKHVKVAINDFTMHLIILEWLGMEKQMQTEEKNNGINNHQRERRNCLRKCFHSFKHVIIDHANVRFFFLISLWTCSHSLNEINSLHYFMCFLLYYLLHLNHADGCFVM